MLAQVYHVDETELATLKWAHDQKQQENTELHQALADYLQRERWMHAVHAIRTPKPTLSKTIIACRTLIEQKARELGKNPFVDLVSFQLWELMEACAISLATASGSTEYIAQGGLIEKVPDFTDDTHQERITYYRLRECINHPEQWDFTGCTTKRPPMPISRQTTVQVTNAAKLASPPLPVETQAPIAQQCGVASDVHFEDNIITIKKKESAPSGDALDCQSVNGLDRATDGSAVLLNCSDSEDERIVEDTTIDKMAAKKLLLAVYGNSEASCYHVMTGVQYDAKYVKGDDTPIDGDIIDAHLAGAMTVSSYPTVGDWTRLYQSDTDNDETWAIFQQEARVLADCGFYPLLEESGMPGRGGHVMLHFSAEVHGPSMMDVLMKLAPTITSSNEQWPYLSANAVRLPGGLYCHKPEPTWCTLRNGYGTIIARDGRGVCSALFLNQTPARLIPVPEGATAPSLGATPVSQEGATPAKVVPNWSYRKQPRVEHTSSDAVVQWFNEHYSVDDILPRERNGCAFAVWRGERTPSVVFYPKTNSWCDFGNGWVADGKRYDGGDCFELAVRVRCTDPSDIPLVKKQLRREVQMAMEVRRHA